MLVIKVWLHFCKHIKAVFLKLVYRNRFQIGKNVTWRKRFDVMIDKNGRIEIGDDCFFNNDCSLNSNGNIHIGNGSLFGENVKIYDHNHRFKDKNIMIKNQGFSVGDVYIGNHCWIGSNVIILKGAHIGDNCVIGASTVISSRVPDGVVVKQKNELMFEKIHV